MKMDKVQLGNLLKQQRKNLGLTQQEVAASICSQPLLSHFEAGDYMPAGDILLALCERLGLSENQLSLANYFSVSPEKTLNAQCEALCRAHDYERLRAFLRSDEVLDELSEQNLQAYQYYLAVAQAQLGEIEQAELDFGLALAENQRNTLGRLCLASLAVLAAQKGQKKTAENLLNEAFSGLSALQYEENLNVLYYLKAVAQKRLNEPAQALSTLEAGIAFIAEHDSHYLLANCYYLAAKLVAADSQMRFLNHSQLFAELYGERVFKGI